MDKGAKPLDAHRVVQRDRTDTATDMRRQRPADGEVVDQVGHDRISVAVTGRREVDRADAKVVLTVLLEAEFLFKTPRAPLITGPGAAIEPVVEGLAMPQAPHVEAPAFGVEGGPATFAAEIPSARRGGCSEQLRLC